MTLLRLGVIGSSAKENEHRLPIHPDHLPHLDADLRRQITLEHGYGARFGVDDARLGEHVAGFASREQLLVDSEVVLLPKPQLSDVAALGPGQVLWGWPHCVQDTELTQVAIDQRLTLIAFEAMNHWTQDGAVGLHVFHKNNELAGYCSVLHALELAGLTGDYGRRLTAVVIGFGATARGAVTALNAHGVHEVAVLTNRAVAAVGSPIHSVRIRQFEHDPGTDRPSDVITERGREPLPAYLADNDIVVNCTLQDTANPLIYLRKEDMDAFRPGSVLVDVSCDLGMGFDFARPTSFDDPTFVVGDNVLY
ncbi:MAG TPA: alanine dehydrogenase, partial [Nocardioides sp.]|nr:alanine dehydrogenase [Nocardioides sp.]